MFSRWEIYWMDLSVYHLRPAYSNFQYRALIDKVSFSGERKERIVLYGEGTKFNRDPRLWILFDEKECPYLLAALVSARQEKKLRRTLEVGVQYLHEFGAEWWPEKPGAECMPTVF